MSSRVYLIIVTVLASLAAVFAALWVLTFMNSMEWAINYDALNLCYQTLQTQYSKMQSQYYDIVRSLSSSNSYPQLLNANKSVLNMLDNITAILTGVNYYEGADVNVFVPYNYNALIKVSILSTGPAVFRIESAIGNTIQPLWNITGARTIELVVPPGIYTVRLFSLIDGNNMFMNITTLLITNTTDMINMVKNEDTYEYTVTMTDQFNPLQFIPIIVPYGYNMTISINITSSRLMWISFYQMSYGGYVATLPCMRWSTGYHGTVTLPPGLYLIEIQPITKTTVSINVKPTAIIPIS